MTKINSMQHVTADGTVKLNPGKKEKLLEPFKAHHWTEATVNLALRRINAGVITAHDIFSVNKALYDGEGVSLDASHVQKGRSWLDKFWKTPSGKEREETIMPFSYRETEIMKKFDTIKLKDFYSERGNYYVPLYVVYGDNTSMEYYMLGGKLNIVG